MCRSAPKRGERSLLLAGLWRRTTFSKPWRDLEIVSNAERSANSKHLKSAGWLLTHFTTLPPSPTSHLLQSGCLVIIKQILHMTRNELNSLSCPKPTRTFLPRPPSSHRPPLTPLKRGPPTPLTPLITTRPQLLSAAPPSLATSENRQ